MNDGYDEIREAAAAATHAIAEAGLVLLAFGNASAVDRDLGVFAIKPSGIPCATVRPDQMVVVAIDDGQVVAGDLRPSSDEPTHRRLYQVFAGIGGVVHTHSLHASAWAQAGRAIPCLGTTHADHFRGEVPVTRPLTDAEIANSYEWHTGVAITELYSPGGLDPLAAPGVLVRSHGPFVWGPSAAEAAHHAGGCRDDRPARAPHDGHRPIGGVHRSGTPRPPLRPETRSNRVLRAASRE